MIHRAVKAVALKLPPVRDYVSQIKAERKQARRQIDDLTTGVAHLSRTLAERDQQIGHPRGAYGSQPAALISDHWAGGDPFIPVATAPFVQAL